MNSKYVLITYTIIPRDNRITHIKGWRDIPNSTQYNESIGFKNNIKANHTFESLTLIKPLWYFHLQGGDRLSWPDPNNVDSSIVLDDNYASHTSAELEASFLLLIKGWIPKRNIEQNFR